MAAWKVQCSCLSPPPSGSTPDTVFNISRFLLSNLLKEEAPFGISKTYCIFALAKQAKALGANKLARFALEKLSQYKVPLTWQEQVDVFALSISSRPFNDADELLPSCFRCQTVNPLLNQGGDRCIACGHVFVRSFCSFEILPLVRFTPPPSVSPTEALMLIRRDPPPKQLKQNRAPSNPWRENEGPDVHSMGLAGDLEAVEQEGILDVDDPFTKAMLDFEPNGNFSPTEADRNMLPDVPVVMCHACNQFFHEEDWELAIMSKGCCPFCGVKVGENDTDGSATSFPASENK